MDRARVVRRTLDERLARSDGMAWRYQTPLEATARATPPKVERHTMRIPTFVVGARDSNLRPQPCECGSCLRTGREKTAPNALSYDDHDTGRSATTAHYRSCGAFCGAFLGIEAHLSVVDPQNHQEPVSALVGNTGKVDMPRSVITVPREQPAPHRSGDTCAHGHPLQLV